jgi:hypothetical protein
LAGGRLWGIANQLEDLVRWAKDRTSEEEGLSIADLVAPGCSSATRNTSAPLPSSYSTTSAGAIPSRRRPPQGSTDDDDGFRGRPAARSDLRAMRRQSAAPIQRRTDGEDRGPQHLDARELTAEPGEELPTAFLLGLCLQHQEFFG